MELVPQTILNSLAYNAIYTIYLMAECHDRPITIKYQREQAVKRKTAANKNVM